jgi:CDP-diacylglycerol--glycerol-3-phosphate 3-phosphatidyltransferase
VAVAVARQGGASVTRRFVGGFGAALIVQRVLMQAARRRIGPEPVAIANLVTRSRAAAGSVLAGLVAVGVRARPSLTGGPAGWLAWSLAVWGATLGDWLDGPLARRMGGPTRFGAVLDIEADSWVTLWGAAGAVAWGGLPRWCLVPPIVRYALPALDVLGGGLPQGGGPWWSRGTGVAQMALILAALAPVRPPWGTRALVHAAGPVSAAQLLTLLVLLAQRLRRRCRSPLERVLPGASAAR